MGRKSSAKAQQQPSGSTTSGSSGSSGGSPLKMAAIAAVAIAIVGAVYVLQSSPAAPASQPAASTAAVSPVPESALQGPHPQTDLPPLPFGPEPPARSPEVVRAAYKFAAEHSEILSYVPCYCGCERSGHRGNEDCFVTRRDNKGDVVEWEPHGAT